MPGQPRLRSLTTLVLAVLGSVRLGAQTPPLPVTADGRPIPKAPDVIARNEAGVGIRATRISSPLRIDGVLDEEVYARTKAITEFVQQDPEGVHVSERTEAWVFYDERNIYVACRCWDTNPARIVANDMRRDSSNLRQNDNFGVALDTFHDRRNGYLFYVSPVGGMFDGATSDERTNNGDWNTVWVAKTTRTDKGWFVEIAIPFKSLRYRAGRQQEWGINLRRAIRGKNENAYITPTKPQWGGSAFLRSSAAATLTGLEAPPTSKNLEIKPSLISSLTTDRLTTPAVDADVHVEGALDVKYGITKGLTADFTYNTDFAQVEADEVQVNLTRFNLQFPEKREFFLEGQGLYTFGGIGGSVMAVPGASAVSGGADPPTIFYSRRIGLHGARPVPILAGARLSGRVGKYTVGLLNIASDADQASNARVTDFTVMRVRRDVFRRSTVGALFTGRSASSAGWNQVFGVDANFALFENLSLTGYLARSRTENVTGDDTSYRANMNYSSDRYAVQVDRTVVGPRFIPDVGFLPRQNFERSYASARFSPRPVTSTLVRKYYFETSLNYVTDNHQRLESREALAAFRIELHNSDAFNIEYFRDYESLVRPFQVATGIRIPPGGYTFQHLRTAWALGQQHRLSGAASVDIGSFYDGTRKTATFGGRVGLHPQIGIEPTISVNWISRGAAEAVVKATGARATFTVTPRMFVGALVQYASGSNALTTNVRFRWEYQPGSELFIVYSDSHDTRAPDGAASLQNRGLVVKLNKLFRL